MAVNTKIFTRVLYKTATTLQHYDFVLLSKHILITWKSPLDFQKLKMFMALVYFGIPYKADPDPDPDPDLQKKWTPDI